MYICSIYKKNKIKKRARSRKQTRRGCGWLNCRQHVLSSSATAYRRHQFNVFRFIPRAVKNTKTKAKKKKKTTNLSLKTISRRIKSYLLNFPNRPRFVCRLRLEKDSVSARVAREQAVAFAAVAPPFRFVVVVFFSVFFFFFFTLFRFPRTNFLIIPIPSRRRVGRDETRYRRRVPCVHCIRKLCAQRAGCRRRVYREEMKNNKVDVSRGRRKNFISRRQTRNICFFSPAPFV